MKPIKGISRDNATYEQPDGTYPFGKNGVQYESGGAVMNEPGFRRMEALLPYRFNGLIETDTKPVVFSTDNVNSAIGFFNPVTELYEPIVDDNPGNLINFPPTGEQIGFHTDWYIRGQAQRNYKGELVVAFTDKNNLPMYLNCDTPALKALSDLRLFPFFREPKIDVTESSGGTLDAGAYFIAAGYEKNDGTSTAYSAVSDVVLVTATTTGGSDKSLQILITNADTNYDYIRIAIISRVKGVLKAVELTDYLPVTSGIVQVNYTGDNPSTDKDISEILVAPVVYDKVTAIGQLNDYLYIIGLHQEADINDMQPWANLIYVEFESNLIDVTAPPEEHKSGKKKSFLHGEVIPLYVRYHKARGGFTKWYHAPGLTPASSDLVTSTENTGGATHEVFKLEDTIRQWDPTAKTGSTGIWQNNTELYPDTIDFDSTTIGGRNLRNQKVMHHKMPSLAWCKAHFYASEVEYGRTKLDLLGIRATNVRIPDKYKGIIDGYEIGYAKRTSANATIHGQGLMLHPAVDHYGHDKPTGQVPLYTSGGNWETGVLHRSDNNYNDNLELMELRPTAFRVHPFEMLFFKPAISPTLIHAQYKLRYNNIAPNHGFLEDGDNGSDLHDGDFPYSYVIDYTQGELPVFPATNFRFKEIKSSLYLTNTINAENFINTRHENVFAGYLSEEGNPWAIESSAAMIRIRGNGTVGAIAFEEAYLINLVTIRDDVYQNFYSQPLVSAGQWQPIDQTNTVWGGDTYCCDYTWHTYGRHDSFDTKGDGIKGKKVIRRIACETSANLYLRYEIPGNIYSKWYPVSPVSFNDPNNYITIMDRSQDPNQFGYDREFNTLNDFTDQTIFSPFLEQLSDFPFRIHRGGKASRTGRPRAWRSFLPLDYYEMPKDKGVGVNIEGQDDQLLIHMENALFLTRDKAKLESGALSITLGSGDIFQFEPQEAESSKLGYAGTNHDLACLKSPVGYIFPDAKSGEVFLFKGKLNQINPGLNRFLYNYLDPQGINVLQGNGITVGWDQKYRRILLTVKHKIIPPNVKPFEDTPDFWNNLQVGDLISYGNRIITYTGRIIEGCPADIPSDIVTWRPVEDYCILNDGRKVGLQAFSKREKLVNGVVVSQEDNTTNGGDGPYFPPVGNLVACPVDPDIITWDKRDPICLTDGGTSTCPPGYTLSEDDTICVKVTTVPATITSSGYQVAPSTNAAYSDYGMRVYTSAFTNADLPLDTAAIDPTHLSGSSANPYWANLSGTLVDGPMNRDGVWIDTNGDGARDALANGTQTTFAYLYNNTGAERTVYAGVAGDNLFELKINGVSIAQVSNRLNVQNFKYWHIIPITLKAGTNSFNVVGTGDGSVNDSVAMVIYDNSSSQLVAATSDADLTILFHSSQLIGQTIDIATCPNGYELDTSGGSGSYVCKLTQTTAPIGSSSSGANTGVVHWQNRARLVNGVGDGYTEPNTSGANFIPDETNTTLCPISGPPETITLPGTVRIVCSDNGCRQQGSVSLQFTFTTPTPKALEVLAGTLIRVAWSGEQQYAGNDLFTPPEGANPNPYYAANGVNKPFRFTIPANVTSYTVTEQIYQEDGGMQDGISMFAWICHTCQYPITDLYLKIDQPATGYTLNVSSITTSLTVHNV